VVSDNEISDITKLQADGGAIYTLSSDPGGVVSGNYINSIPIPEDQRWAHVGNSVDFDAWATPPTARLLAERGAA
jgi:hypothetical protein